MATKKWEAKYEETPTQVKHREERNRARAEATKRLGHSPKGDIAHIKPLAGGGRSGSGNVHIEAVAKNRGWRKGQHGYKVPTEKH